MKLGLFLIASYFSILAHAQEATTAPPTVTAAPPASEIEKFSYIPPFGTAYLDAGFTYLSSKSTLKAPAGTVSNAKTTLTSFNYLFGYGVSDYLALGLRGRILMTHKSDYDYGSGSTLNGTSASYKRAGWEEPELGGIWRIRDNTSGKMRMHLTAGVRPKLQQAKNSTATADGNGGIGGTQFSAGLGLFKEVKDVELQLVVQRNLLTVTKYENASDSTKAIEDDDHQTTNIKVGFLAFTSDELTFGGNLLYDMSEKYTSSATTNGVIVSDMDYDSGNIASLEVLGKYKVENSSLIQLTVSSLLTSTQTIKVGTTRLDQQIDSGTAYSLSWLQEF